MKRTGLIVTIIVCLFIFFISLTAGIILTVRTIGWAALKDNSQVREKIQVVLDSLQDLDIGVGLGNAYTIDETRTVDLDGIKTIRISGVSEALTVRTGGSQLKAQLTGKYRTHGQMLSWIAEKQGSELLIHAKYPALSLMTSNLAIDVQIPADYAGDMRVSTVSGSCDLPDTQARDWSSVQLSSTSGRLTVAEANFPELILNTVSGEIKVENCVSMVNCTTISGNAAITWADFAESKFDSVSGDINLQIPANADCRLTFTTVSGDFTNKDLAMQMTVQKERRLEGTLNNGNHDLAVHTVSGNLVMKKS